MILYVAVNGHLDDLPLDAVKPFENEFHPFMEKEYADIGHEIRRSKEMSDATAAKLAEAIRIFKTRFIAERGIRTVKA
jgi:F-type H+-transporting ATPase subunit alpha